MPNWCECYLEINSDNNENLIKFFDDNKENDETVLSFNISVPIPENEEDNWYSWRCENWGTKWDCYDLDIEYEDSEQLALTFNTAWSPPEGIVEELRSRYPDLSFTCFYDEPGMEIAGYY